LGRPVLGAIGNEGHHVSRAGLIPLLLLMAACALIAAGGLAYRRGPLWYRSLLPPRPPGIVIHHSATPATIQGRPLTAEAIEQAHAQRGWGRDFAGHVYHIGYHHIILSDGTVQAGRPEWMSGAHCRGHNDMLGICLIGDFSRGPGPTRAQREALLQLVHRLVKKYGLSPAQVYRHSDLEATECPGQFFPWEDFQQALAVD